MPSKPKLNSVNTDVQEKVGIRRQHFNSEAVILKRNSQVLTSHTNSTVGQGNISKAGCFVF